MSIPDSVVEYHREQAAIAAQIYQAGLLSKAASEDWYDAVLISRKRILKALRDTDYLTNISKGLQKNGGHLRFFRHVLAPPISQDQFALLCPAYSKSAENKGSKLSESAANEIATTVSAGRDKLLARWVERGTRPTSFEIKEILRSVGPLMSQQLVATLRRSRLSIQQETAVIDLLTARGWERHRSALIVESAELPARNFMHKTKFATDTRPQEVDIACGCGKSVILAMECKVTNDQTNSVKRINDVLKKATAWQDHWGSFVRTAALLQGVVGYKDVSRLLTAKVEVFWSHDLASFANWIDNNVSN